MIPDQTIQFRFPTVRSKLQNLFPFDPKTDIEIIFKNNKYELQTAYLRLQSAFFKNFNPNVNKIIKIEEDFNEGYFQSIMKCFYGGNFNCPRTALFQVWKILQYLKIQTFKKQIIKDMKHNFEKYNFFQLISFAFFSNIEQVFSNCLAVLDNQNFIQLKRYKQQLMNCPLQVFRFLINTHNRRNKNKRALNSLEINNLIGEYSQKYDFSKQFYNELKFQLIQKTQLSSEQYRLIFIQGAKTQSTKQISEINFSKKSSRSNNQTFLAQSAQMLTSKPIKEQQKQHWILKLQNLKKQFQNKQNQNKLLQSSVESISKCLKRKNEQSKMKERSLSKMETFVRQVQKQISEKTQSLKKISERINKLQNSSSSKGKNKGAKQMPEQQEQQKDEFVQSHIIPSYFLGDIINQAQGTKKQAALKPPQKTEPTASTANFSKKKKTFYQSPTGQKQKQKQKQRQNSQEYLYRNFLVFDKDPVSVPKKYLDSLAQLLGTDLFLKKRQLSLLFRRSKTSNQNIGDPSVIKNRPALLVLIQTTTKKYLGGYISVQIPSFVARNESICDYQAFIFSLTHNVKMKIMKGEQKSAISLSKFYLLSFANDLMISNDCLNQESFCSWPSVYQVPKNSKCTSAKDLIGTTSQQFKIQNIDIYEVRNQQIEMIL